MVGWFKALPSSPPSLVLFRFHLRPFFFRKPFQGLPASGQVCWCWCLLPPSSFGVPRLVFRLSSFSSHLRFHLIFIPFFILLSISLVWTLVVPPCYGRGCVCVKHLNRCKTSSRGTLHTIRDHVQTKLPDCMGYRT